MDAERRAPGSVGPSRRARAGAAAMIAVALGAGSALAADAPVRVDYQVDPAAGGECTSARGFLDALRAQAPGARAAGDGERARALRVRIGREGEELRGRIEIDEVDGMSSVREVRGARCADVTSALALIAALAIDAGAAQPQPLPPPEPQPLPRSLPRPRPAPPPAARSALGVQVGAFGAIAPEIAWGPLFSFDRGRRDAGLTPALRLSLALLEAPSALTPSGGEATFWWRGIRASGSPWALRIGQVLLRPVAGLELGALRGRGAEVARPLDQTRAWVSASVAGRAQWEIGGVLLLEAEGGALLPFVRDTFVFRDPDEVIHRPPALSGFGAIGLGVLLPM